MKTVETTESSASFPSIDEQAKRIQEAVKKKAPKPNKVKTEAKAEKALKMILAHNTETMLFCDQEGLEYIRYPSGGYIQTLRIRSQTFGEMVQHEFYETYRSVLGGQTLADVKSALAGRAKMLAKVRPVWRRVALHQETPQAPREVWIDITNSHWEAVRITKQGWSKEQTVKPSFIRSKHDTPLPMPERHKEGAKAGMELFRKYCNLSDDDFLLLVAFLIGAWNPSGAYPLLQIHAQHGSGKTTVSGLIKRLIDPQKALIRSLPRDEESLMMNAQNSWLLCYDFST
ncbi:MAG: hypothetical protein ACOVSW_16170 [Candidatus Kapaibacteriota bacterium]